MMQCFLPLQHYGKTVTARTLKVSGYISSGIGILLLHSPGGSTLQLGAGWGLLCLVPPLSFYFYLRGPLAT